CRIPLQYVLGECEFYGLRLLCDPRALIPRPETELLVDVALKYTPLDRPSVLADLGTGSGCLAIAVAVNRPLATILAVDISQDALDLAQANARLHGAETRIRFFRGDLVAPLVAAGLADSVEGVLANLPYVAEDEYACLQPEVHYEPRQALVSGPSGVEAYAKLAAQLHVLPRLRWAALELPATRAQCILGLFRMDGWEKELIKDYSGFDRVLLLVREP
ncbi:MAG: peptide chain release factor N(5)-glutamine methyltransferase, partial [Armatimonadetes bacterium]|nr:peptide chain release factor N(5)-glutamine methyltransferase [Armatimonadota bacterium]